MESINSVSSSAAAAHHRSHVFATLKIARHTQCNPSSIKYNVPFFTKQYSFVFFINLIPTSTFFPILRQELHILVSLVSFSQIFPAVLISLIVMIFWSQRTKMPYIWCMMMFDAYIGRGITEINIFFWVHIFCQFTLLGCLRSISANNNIYQFENSQRVRQKWSYMKTESLCLVVVENRKISWIKWLNLSSWIHSRLLSLLGSD